MKISKKVLYFSIFAAAVSCVLFVRLFFIGQNYLYFKQQSSQLMLHNKTILSDTSWAKWKPPINPTEYITLWLFSLDNHASIFKSSIVECHDGIKSLLIELTCESTSLDHMKNSFNNPPFGKIVIKDITDVELQKKKITLEWYWSSELQINESITPINDFVLLNLDTIILSENDWLVKINNEWISKSSDTKHKNIKILNVTNNSAQVEVMTPNGPKIVELRCGLTMKVNYL